MKITRRTLAESFALQKNSLTIKESKIFVDFMFDRLTFLLQEGKQLRITKVGTLKKVSKNERLGRNPKTNEPFVIKARDVVALSPKSDIEKRLTALQFSEKLYKSLPPHLDHLQISTVDQCVKSLVTQITSVTLGNRMEIRGFGSFYSATTSPYMARNPRTGEEVQKPECTRVRFRPSNSLITFKQ